MALLVSHDRLPIYLHWHRNLEERSDPSEIRSDRTYTLLLDLQVLLPRNADRMGNAHTWFPSHHHRLHSYKLFQRKKKRITE